LVTWAVAIETNVGIIEIGAVNSEATKKVTIVIADGLGREESFGELRTVIHANASVCIIKERKGEIAMTNAKHAANTGICTMEIKGFRKSDVVA
jgi:hypothetical protein